MIHVCWKSVDLFSLVLSLSWSCPLSFVIWALNLFQTAHVWNTGYIYQLEGAGLTSLSPSTDLQIKPQNCFLSVPHTVCVWTLVGAHECVLAFTLVFWHWCVFKHALMSERKSSRPIKGKSNCRRDARSGLICCPNKAYSERAWCLVKDSFLELRVCLPSILAPEPHAVRDVRRICSGANVIIPFYSHNLLRLCESNPGGHASRQLANRAEALGAFLGLHGMQNWSPEEKKPRQIQQLCHAVHA